MTEELNKEEKKEVTDVMAFFGGDFKPEVIEDTETIDFDKPIKGGYLCRFVKLNRYTGNSEKCKGGTYDFWSLNLQVLETLDGEEAGNRYLSKTYSNTESEFDGKVIEASEGKRKLMNDLFTAGVKYETPEVSASTTADSIVAHIAPQIVDQTCYVRAYPSKSKKQVVRIIKEVKIKKSSKEVADSNDEW